MGRCRLPGRPLPPPPRPWGGLGVQAVLPPEVRLLRPGERALMLVLRLGDQARLPRGAPGSSRTPFGAIDVDARASSPAAGPPALTAPRVPAQHARAGALARPAGAVRTAGAWARPSLGRLRRPRAREPGRLAFTQGGAEVLAQSLAEEEPGPRPDAHTRPSPAADRKSRKSSGRGRLDCAGQDAGLKGTRGPQNTPGGRGRPSRLPASAPPETSRRPSPSGPIAGADGGAGGRKVRGRWGRPVGTSDPAQTLALRTRPGGLSGDAGTSRI